MNYNNEVKNDSKSYQAAIVLLVLIIFALAGYICYDKGIIFKAKNVLISEDEDKVGDNKNSEEKEDDNKKCKESEITKVNKRLYSINSDTNQQRYYLLLDDLSYEMNQDFLTKKTYILDMNMVEGNEIIREVDMASILKPLTQNYINTHKNSNQGKCLVKYHSAINQTPPQINYETEITFIGSYSCINNNVETSIGSEIYAYNVGTNTVRSLGTIN